MNDKTYTIPVEFWENFETKEDLQNYINRRKDDLEEAKTKILRLAYITEPKKFIGDNVDILEYIKDELDILFMEIEVQSQEIGNAEVLLEQWNDKPQVINESSPASNNNKNKNMKILEDIQKDLKDIKNDLAVIKEEIKTQNLPSTPYPFTEPYIYPYTPPYYIKHGETYCTDSTSDSTIDVSD